MEDMYSFYQEQLIKKELNGIETNLFWSHLRNKALENRIPFHGHFELTPLCNFNCVMCYVHLNKDQMNGQALLDFESWKRLIDKSYDAGMVVCSLTGGECLTHPYFDDIYMYLKKKGIIIFVLTNGYLLKEKLSLFKKYPPALIQVSIYGNDEDTYKKVTGIDAFKVVKESVDSAIKMGLNISIAITANKYLKSIGSILRYYKEKGISVQSNNFLMKPYENTNRKIENLQISIEESINISKEFFFEENGVEPEPYKGILPKPNSIKPKDYKKGIACVAGKCEFLINWRGQMGLCVALPEPEGSLIEENFEVVWKRLVKKAEDFLMPVECVGCAYQEVCVLCPASHLMNASEGHCNKRICEEGYRMVREGLIKPKKIFEKEEI